jgi:hypothetical protein
MPVAMVPEPTTPTLPTWRVPSAPEAVPLGVRASSTTCELPGSA